MKLKAEAIRLGFCLAGVTTPHRPNHLDIFHHWLAQNHHAGMTYLSMQDNLRARADPKLLMAESRSVLVFGTRYPAPDLGETQSQKTGKGLISTYAQGDDYHAVIPLLHNELMNWLQNYLGLSIKWRGWTDSVPILERDLAYSAGLGWIGKNSCLINPIIGSCFFISEIFMDYELDPTSTILPDRCGSCTRCLKACPTQCILPDRTIDSNRCIAYLTIENKGGIPIDLRRKIGNSVFGCDICQAVCPWNIKTKNPNPNLPPIHPSFLPRAGFTELELPAELLISLSDFNQKYTNSPVMRAKRQGYLRNIATVIGNQKDSQALSVLKKSMSVEEDPILLEHLLWAQQECTIMVSSEE